MKKNLLVVVYSCAGILFSMSMQAQVKGDPVLKTVLPQLKIQKSGSRLSPALQKLYEHITGRKALLTEEKPVAPNDALDKYLQVKDGQVVVDITIKENMSAAKAVLQQLGLHITGVYGRVISGTISINALPQLASVNAIQFARPAYRPMRRAGKEKALVQRREETAYNGAVAAPVVSQGDTAQRSFIARKKYNVNGKGVKVGILSDSYNNLGTAAIGVLRGELPGPGNPFNFKKPVEVLEDLADTSGTDEGRAMAEIVHDVAPGAELYFHTAFLGEADFAQGIQDLAGKGCKVIADDIAYLDEPFFQDGIIAQSVDLAKKKGIAYFSSAGNNFNNSYESDYHPTTDEALGPGNGTAHNFSAPDASPRYYQPIYIPSGGSFVASFQWDQPSFSAGGAANESDLDIYLIDIYGNIVAAGATDNIMSGDPIELFGYDNNTPNYTFFLVILKFAGPDPTHIKYNMYNDAQFYTPTNPSIPGLFAPTLVGHAKADGAIATGAAFYLSTPEYGVDTPRVEFFSSLGGVANYFDAAGNRIAPLVRRKPEITAPDGGNTSFFNPFGNGDITQDADSFPNFFGTSAAAPHAAGVAALMIEAEKLNNLTPAQIKGILSSNTVDMDNIYTDGFDKGFDFNTGYGLVKADGAVGDVKFPNVYIKDLTLQPLCSTNPSATRIWKIINPNSFEVETHWLLLGGNQHGSMTAPPGDSYFPTNTINFGNYPVPNIVILDWDDNLGFTRLDIENSIKTPCGNSSAREITGGALENAVAKPMLADVYPNPSTNVFRVYLALADQQPIDLQLFSIDGKKLLEKHINQTKGIVPIDATAYKPGIYLLHIKQGTFNKTIKLIRQ
jgi:subtilisin family serine protease